MKLDDSSREKLAFKIRGAAAASSLSYAEIARTSRVHTSQVSRICRGQFKTLSHNVLQICKVIGLETEVVKSAEVTKNQHARKLTQSILGVWDQTPADAKRIERFLRDLAQLRSPPPS